MTAPRDGSSAELHFLFGVHNHQPAGNFDGVVAEAAASAYHPFFEVLRAEPDVRLTVHCSGSLLAWLRERAAPTFDLLGTLAARGQVELLTGGFYEPVLPMLPDTDKVGQVQRLTEFLRASFGVTPRGMWLAERVWEPQLPRVLRAAGVEFVVVDDHHFALAGLDPETLGGYYLTDDQGAAVAVFPISERLRYLVPFAEPAEAVAYLSARRRAGSITLVDDGEKFGVWPGTHRLVYEERWLRRFLDALRQAPGLRVSTFSRVLDSQPSRGRVYLPTASYTEMGEWALPAPAAEEIDAARERLRALPDGAALARLLRGGSWRGFLVKYPEVGDAYWRMLRLSRRLEAALTARPDDARLLEARDRLWRGQANDAYWHGVFGGCYLPHLRRAVRSALIDGDARLAAAEARPALGWEEGADNAAGRVEIRLWSRDAAITLCPHAGGALTELAFRPRALDVADVLTRRREAYHARIAQAASAAPAQGDQARSIHDRVAVKEAGLDRLLEYDGLRRASLREGLLRRETGVDALNPWAAAVLAFGAVEMTHRVARGARRAQRHLHLGGPARDAARPREGRAPARRHGANQRGVPADLARHRAPRCALGRAVEPRPHRGRRLRPVLPASRASVPGRARRARGRARAGHGRRVDRRGADARLRRARRLRVGARRDRLALGGGARAHLSGLLDRLVAGRCA